MQGLASSDEERMVKRREGEEEVCAVQAVYVQCPMRERGRCARALWTSNERRGEMGRVMWRRGGYGAVVVLLSIHKREKVRGIKHDGMV